MQRHLPNIFLKKQMDPKTILSIGTILFHILFYQAPFQVDNFNKSNKIDFKVSAVKKIVMHYIFRTTCVS